MYVLKALVATYDYIYLLCILTIYKEKLLQHFYYRTRVYSYVIYILIKLPYHSFWLDTYLTACITWGLLYSFMIT